MQRAREGIPLTWPLWPGDLTGEEMDHLAYVAGKPQSMANSRQSLADYISVIRTEAIKRGAADDRELLLAAQKKNLEKKAYMEEKP